VRNLCLQLLDDVAFVVNSLLNAVGSVMLRLHCHQLLNSCFVFIVAAAMNTVTAFGNDAEFIAKIGCNSCHHCCNVWSFSNLWMIKSVYCTW
jgi:hypothetical protein